MKKNFKRAAGATSAPKENYIWQLNISPPRPANPGAGQAWLAQKMTTVLQDVHDFISENAQVNFIGQEFGPASVIEGSTSLKISCSPAVATMLQDKFGGTFFNDTKIAPFGPPTP